MKKRLFFNLYFCLVCGVSTCALTAQTVATSVSALGTQCSENPNLVWSKLFRKCINQSSFDVTLASVSQNAELSTARKDLLGLLFSNDLLRVEVFYPKGSFILEKNELMNEYESRDNNVVLKQKNGTWYYSEVKPSSVAQSVKLYASND